MSSRFALRCHRPDACVCVVHRIAGRVTPLATAHSDSRDRSRVIVIVDTSVLPVRETKVHKDKIQLIETIPGLQGTFPASTLENSGFIGPSLESKVESLGDALGGITLVIEMNGCPHKLFVVRGVSPFDATAGAELRGPGFDRLLCTGGASLLWRGRHGRGWDDGRSAVFDEYIGTIGPVVCLAIHKWEPRGTIH